MYVVLTVILLLVFWTVSGFGQKRETRNTELDRIRKQMELREELHRKMLQNLLHGTHDESLFGDMEKLMEDAMKDAGSTSSFSFSIGQNVETEWQESSAGRTLLITPRTKDQKLDINVAEGMVTIKGNTENTNFQNSFSIPQDCDSGKVKMDQKDGKIVMFFPWIIARKVSPPISPKKEKRIPLPKTESDVTI